VEKPARAAHFLQDDWPDLRKAEWSLDNLNQSRGFDHESWLRVGMGVHAATDGAAEGLSLWLDWSRTTCADKFSDADCRARWKSFKREGVAVGTLVEWAKADSGRTPPWAGRNGAAQPAAGGCTERPPAARELSFKTGDQLAAEGDSLQYLIQDVIAEGEKLLISAPKKTMKTSIMLDAAMSIATGTPFLGRFEVPEPRPVLLLLTETSEVEIKNRVRRIAAARDVDWAPKNLHYVTEQLTLGETAQNAMVEKAINDTQAALTVFDPASKVLSRIGEHASNMFCFSRLLNPIDEIAARTGTTLGFIHHTTGAGGRIGARPRLDDSAFPGLSQWARQWISLSKRAEMEPREMIHSVFFHFAGSDSRSLEGLLRITEGARDTSKPLNGQGWQVEFIDDEALQAEYAERRQARAAKRATKEIESTKSAIVTFLSKQPRQAATSRKLARGVPKPRRHEAAIAALVEEGVVARDGSVQSGTRTAPGIRLTEAA
jgi:hypothetical protein